MTMFRFPYCFRWLACACLAIATGAQAAGTDVMSGETCKEAVPQVAKAFAGLLAPDRRAGTCLAGDFNGDGKPDVFMVVKVLVDKLPATTGVKTIYPFFDKEGENVQLRGRLQFLALHSTAKASKGDWTLHDKLLLDGGSPIMVLGHPDMASDMQRITQRSPVVKELQVPRQQMRGEGIELGTEAVTAVIYWNGKTYKFHEDPEGP